MSTIVVFLSTFALPQLQLRMEKQKFNNRDISTNVILYNFLENRG